MSNRIFQSVIAQLKEATDRTIGVMDGEGFVVSSSDPTLVGEKWPDAVLKLGAVQDGLTVSGKRTFRTLNGSGSFFDYAAFTDGEDESARSTCIMAAVALSLSLIHISSPISPPAAGRWRRTRWRPRRC